MRTVAIVLQVFGMIGSIGGAIVAYWAYRKTKAASEKIKAAEGRSGAPRR